MTRIARPDPADDWHCLVRDADVRIDGAPDGPLSGLSFLAKDLYDVAGHPTFGGSPDWAATHPLPDSTSPVILQLLDQGASLAGKTATDELACGMFGENAHYGTPRNARYPDRVPGGSSSGSAAAVAAGLADFAIGTDTGGSIRVPSSFCGIYGIRPSHGRLPLTGCIPMAPGFDTAGWFARDADLLARIGDALLPAETQGPVRRFVVARDLMARVDPVARPGFEGLFAALGAHEEVDVAGEAGPEGLLAAFWPLMSRALWNSNGMWFGREKPNLAPGLPERFLDAAKVGAREWREANAARDALTLYLSGLLADDTVVLMPTVHGAPPRLSQDWSVLGAYRTAALPFIVPASLARLPQVVIPGVAVDGAQIGLSLLGRFGADRMLLRAARSADETLRLAGLIDPPSARPQAIT